MKVSVNKQLINKAKNTSKVWLSHGFESVDLNRWELAQSINAGYAYSAQCNGIRNAKNFIGAGYLSLDFDEDWTLDEALSDPFVLKHAAIIYTTPSHRVNGKGDRFRIVFELPENIDKREDYTAILQAFLCRFPEADQCVKDVSRIFYGSSGSNPVILEGRLSQSDVAEIVLLYSSPAQPESSKGVRPYKGKALPIDEVRRMLTFIPSMPGYELWRNICFGLIDHYGAEAIPLINEWSPDYKTGGKAVERFLSNNKPSDSKEKITIATVIYHAKNNGYVLPEQYKAKSDVEKPGPLVLENLYGNGVGFCTIGGHLYEYNDGVYQKLNIASQFKRILSYFSEHHPRYSDSHHVKNAYEYVKQACHIELDEVNPPGLNVMNGFIQIHYDDNNRPFAELLPHSPERVCTYKACFSYDPEADPAILNHALAQMLDPDYKTMLLRNLAASLDIDRVRRMRVRDVKLLLLLGQGSNGKDTVRAWMTLLFGDQGVTAVSLQSFQNADTGRAFNLVPLATSRINWSSENIGGRISECQTLKAFATGDPMNAEEKGIQGFEFRPKAIGLFNLNEKPDFDTQKEAISSRYGVVLFPYTFRQSPDPNKPYERQGDPRLKDDELFISEHILPALFNLLLCELGNLLAEGIDYSMNRELFQDILEAGSHFSAFVKEAGLIECSSQEGLQPSEIFEVYETHCEAQGYLEVISSVWNTTKKILEPSRTDRIIRHHNKLREPLEKCFPSLSRHQTAKGTIYGLCFNYAAADKTFVDSLSPELQEKYYNESKLGLEWQLNGDPQGG